MAFWRGKKKNKVGNLILQDQALICTSSEKSFGLKELSNLTTRFLLRLHCHKRACISSGIQQVSPFREAAHKVTGYVLLLRWRDSFVSNVGGRKSSKGSGHGKTKETGLQVPVTSVSVLCCGLSVAEWMANLSPI